MAKSAVQKITRRAVKSAVKQSDKIASLDHLRNKLAGFEARDNYALERILQSNFKQEQNKEKAAEQQKKLREKFYGKNKKIIRDSHSTVDDILKAIQGNDIPLAELLANKKPRGRAPRSYPPLETAYSSNVMGLSYDAEKKQMFVSFKDGSVYQYVEVPETIYSDLLYTVQSGGSLGERFWDLVRVRGKGNSYKTQYSYRPIKGARR